MKQYERVIYNLLKTNPRLKRIVRDTYQFTFSLVPQKKINTTGDIIERKGFFFGFHDKSPWSFNDKNLLAVKVSNETREPKAGDSYEIGIFRGENYDKYQSICSSRALNWQQGNMMQWVGESDKFIVNDIDGIQNISRIYNNDGQLQNIIELPISSVCPNGDFATSYNFFRLQKYFKGYGYASGFDEELEVKTPITHGISVIDLHSGKSRLLYSVKELESLYPDDTMKGAYHFVTHSLFNKSGNRFYFFHRWIAKNDLIHTRMFSCDVEGRDLHLFPTSGMVSHVAWKSDNEIFAYCSVKEGDKYVLFTDKTNNYKIVGENVLNQDGHPSFCPVNDNLFITDTYPDRFRQSYLILFDMLENRRVNLAKLRQPFKFREELRCDLHPRWNRKGDTICFDSAHRNTRSLCTLKLSTILH